MERQYRPQLTSASIIGGLVLLLSVYLLLNSAWPPTEATTDHVLLGVVLVLFYAVIVRLAGPMARGWWMGYVYFALLAMILTFGLAATLALLVIGTGVGVALWRVGPSSPMKEPYQPINEYFARLATAGGAAIVGYGASEMLQITRPFTDFGDLDNLLRTLLMMQVVYAALIAIGVLTTQRPLTEVWAHVRRTWPVDLAFQWAALLVPFAFYTAGMSPTLIVLVLLMFQAVRFYQVTAARQQLIQRSRDLSTLSTLGQAVSSNLSLDEVLAEVHTRLYELVQPTVVVSVLYDATNDLIEYPAVKTAYHTQHFHKRKPDNGLLDWVIRHREPLQLSALETAAFQQMGIDLAQVTVQAFIGVPLMVGETLIGALAVGHETDPEAFDTLDITVLQTIASQAALAIRNANLYSRTLRLSKNMEIINRSMQQVMFNLDRENLIHTACQIACEVTGASQAAVFIVHERLSLRIAGHIGLDALANDDVAFPYRPDLYTAGPRIEMNLDESDDPDLKAMAQRGGFRSMLEVPLRSSNTLIGVLAVYQSKPHFFDQADVSLLEMLASQVTAAFDNTDLLQALEMYASEQAQLVYLSRVSTSNLDLERVVLDLAGMLSQMIGLPHLDVGILRDDDALDLYCPQSPDYVSITRLPLSDLPDIRLALENLHLSSPHVLYDNDASLSPETRAYMQQHHMRVLMLMPMSVSRQVFGVLMLSAPDRVTVTDTMRRLMEMAIHQVSAQVHNARLYTITEEALSQQLEQLALIEDISHKISQSLDVPTIAQNLLDAVLQATHIVQAEIILKAGVDRWQIFHKHCKEPMSSYAVVDASQLSLELRQVVEQREPREITQTDGKVTMICIPLLSGERMLGILRVEGDPQSRLGVEELNFIRSLAGHAAVSIDNAFLIKEQQFQVQALGRLRELSLHVARSLDDQQITEAILQTTLDVLRGSEAALYAYDRRTDELVPMAGLRAAPNGSAPIEPRLATQPLYEAIRTRQMTCVHLAGTIESDPQGNLIYPTMIAIPLMRYGNVSEVLAVGFALHRDLEPRDDNFIELLAVQVANHLETVILNRTIRMANKRMRAILDSTRDGIILLDNFGRVLDANVQASTLLGVDLREAIGDSFTRFIRRVYARSPLEAEMLALGTEPVGEHRELELPRGETVIYLQTSTLPVRDANSENLGRLLSLRDISEEKQLAMMRESLQRMVIHDLRSPMGAIMTGLSFLQVLVEELDPEATHDIRRTLAASIESAENLLRLMDTLRDIPRMKDIKLELATIDLRTLVMKAYETLRTLFVEAKIDFEVSIAEGITVMVDVDLMRRVLVNLLHNALKFTPERGKVLVTAEIDDGARQLRVRVCDTGPGIPPAMRERIFGEFQQVEGQIPKRGGRGTGLGLTLCKLAIEAHGGTIWVDSEGPLPGACFTFTLPLSSNEAAQQAAS